MPTHDMVLDVIQPVHIYMQNISMVSLNDMIIDFDSQRWSSGLHDSPCDRWGALHIVYGNQGLAMPHHARQSGVDVGCIIREDFDAGSSFSDPLNWTPCL
jgi:hypothetical protein